MAAAYIVKKKKSGLNALVNGVSLVLYLEVNANLNHI